MSAHANYRLMLLCGVAAIFVSGGAARAQEYCFYQPAGEVALNRVAEDKVGNTDNFYEYEWRISPGCLSKGAATGHLGLMAVGKTGGTVTGQVVDQAVGPAFGGAPGYSATPISLFMISGVNKVSHDGFNMTMGGMAAGRTPEYDELDTGFTLGVRLDGSKPFGLAPNTLTFGLFGNYTNTDIELGAVPGYAKSGKMDVDSWSVGGYALISDGWKYGMVTVSGTFGSPHSKDFVYGSTADFDTTGITTSANLGMLVPVGDAKIDLRGAMTYVSVSGDDHTDSLDVKYTNAKLEDLTGTVSARLFGVIATENGMLRPFVQGGVNQRFHYKSTVTVEDTPFTFSDGDTTVFARAGVDFELNRSTQAYISVRGDQGEDIQAIAGQIGMTVKLD